MTEIEADFPVLSFQPGGELQDQAVGLSPSLLTMPPHLPFLNDSSPAIFADALLCMNDFLQVGAGKLLANLKVSCLSSANKSIGGMLARTNIALVETVLYAETIFSPTSLYAENSLFWIAWFCRALAQTRAA